MVEFVAYALFVLLIIGALRYIMRGVELEPSTSATSPTAPHAPTGTEGVLKRSIARSRPRPSTEIRDPAKQCRPASHVPSLPDFGPGSST